MYVFNTEELTAAEARIRKAAKEISEAYERYQNSAIGERMFKYAEITKELKELERKKIQFFYNGVFAFKSLYCISKTNKLT